MLKLKTLLLLLLTYIYSYSLNPDNFKLDNDFFDDLLKSQNEKLNAKLFEPKLESKNNTKRDNVLNQKTRYSFIDTMNLPNLENFFFSKKVPSIIEDFIAKLKSPNSPKYRHIKNCLILNGPPGTGKTMVAEIIARIAKEEGNRKVISAKGNNFGDRFKNSEKEDLREFFETVKSVLDDPKALNNKVIILFDEFDGVAKDGEKQNQFNDNLAVVKQLNDILDVVQDDPRIAIIATTNYLENIDDSIFSRCSIVQIPAPDYDQRNHLLEELMVNKDIAIFQSYPATRIKNIELIEKLKKRAILTEYRDSEESYNEDFVTKVFINRLAYETSDITGRDLKDIVEKAYIRYLRNEEAPKIPNGFGYDIYSGLNFAEINLFKETLFERHLYAAYYEIYSVKYLRKERKNNNKVEHCPFEYQSQEKRFAHTYAFLDEKDMPTLNDILSFENKNGLPIAIDNFLKDRNNRLIIYGPSGTGKSIVAEHIARLSGKKIRYISGNFANMFYSSKQEDLHKYFDEIKIDVKKTKKPVLIVLDGITIDKSQLCQEVIDNLKALNKILVSIEKDKLISVIVVANAYERINHIINVNCESIRIAYPDYKSRKKIFDYYFRKNKIKNYSCLYLSALITYTQDWHINSIRDMINNAAIQSRDKQIQPKVTDRDINVWNNTHLYDFENRKLSPLYGSFFNLMLPVNYVLPLTYSRFFKFLHQNFLIEQDKYQQSTKNKKTLSNVLGEFMVHAFSSIVVRGFTKNFVK